MKTLIICDSVFGNTESVAKAMKEALGKDACLKNVADIKEQDIAGHGLIIACSPTRAFRPTPAMSRFLKSLPTGSLSGKKVTAFDTRMEVEKAPAILRVLARMFGYAAQPMAKILQKKGGTLVLPPAGFFVEGTEGPLKGGELDRARKWALDAKKKAK